MKILWHSVRPTICSGYGSQTALWTPALKAAGYEVAISCSVGQFSGVEVWNGIRMFPHSNHVNNYGCDIVAEHAKQWGADIVWSWLDAFVLRATEVKKVKWAAWVPVDSQPLMKRNKLPLDECKWTIAPTKFGQKMMKDAGLKNPMYVPCAFDPAVYNRSKASRAELKKQFGDVIKQDLTGKFIVNVVSANSGKRKNFPAIFMAWKKFYASHHDAILYLHTEVTGVWGDGEDLTAMMDLYEIERSSVVIVNQYYYNIGSVGNDFMSLMYNASDVHLNTCVGEGFGLPIMDAQACGCPTVVPHFAGAGEIGFDQRVGKGRMEPLVPGGLQFVVDPDAVADSLSYVYDRRDDEDWREAISHQAMDYALPHVMKEYMLPTLARIEEDLKCSPAS